ncbi:MAG: phosphoenolpyruvate carboxykinase (GTP), partial [candidate division NC10 bacterium]|nr:phosphoenolpyruvate carboxykinase (GTP) [candidate division NC10 bacterium]
PIGYLPTRSALDGRGLDVSEGALTELLRVDREAWRVNVRNQAEFFAKFGDRLPAGIREEHEALARRLKKR